MPCNSRLSCTHHCSKSSNWNETKEHCANEIQHAVNSWHVLLDLKCKCTYDVDKLNHGHSKLDGDCVGEITHWTDECVVTFLLKQRLYQSHFIVASQTLHTNTDTYLLIVYSRSRKCGDYEVNERRAREKSDFITRNQRIIVLYYSLFMTHWCRSRSTKCYLQAYLKKNTQMKTTTGFDHEEKDNSIDICGTVQ